MNWHHFDNGATVMTFLGGGLGYLFGQVDQPELSLASVGMALIGLVALAVRGGISLGSQYIAYLHDRLKVEEVQAGHDETKLALAEAMGKLKVYESRADAPATKPQ